MDKKVRLPSKVPQSPHRLLEKIIFVLSQASNPEQRKQQMEHLAAELAAALEAEMCLIYLEPPLTAERCLPRFSNITAGALEALDFHLNPSVIQEVFHSGLPYTNNSLDYRVNDSTRSLIFHIRSVYCHPLAEAGVSFGVLQFVNSKRDAGFGPGEKRLLEMSERPLLSLLKLIRTIEQTERMSFTDDLTQVYNPRYLKLFLAQEIKRCLRENKSLSVIFIDVDTFKEVNNAFGHLVGSETLREIGQLFVRLVRASDIVVRYGGDEFVVVLPNTSLKKAQAIAERIRKKVQSYEFGRRKYNIGLTVSIGVANCPAHTLSEQGLIEKADMAMYRVKGERKNAVRVAG